MPVEPLRIRDYFEAAGRLSGNDHEIIRVLVTALTKRPLPLPKLEASSGSWRKTFRPA
jgi:hypothetical protein